MDYVPTSALLQACEEAEQFHDGRLSSFALRMVIQANEMEQVECDDALPTMDDVKAVEEFWQ